MAEDGPQSRVWLVNAESITVEGGGFPTLKREADRV
jgi:hypothetical protein